MELDAARALLGLGQVLTPDEVEQAFSSRRDMLAGRVASAPTDNLRAKYKESLEELERAHAALMAHLRPALPHLSQTQLGDLPSAQPVYTNAGLSGTNGAPAANLLQAGKLLAERYEVRRRIGVGGMGEVYLAFDRNRNEEIAIKALLPHLLTNRLARERFLTEAKVASSLSHPNIVNVFDVQRDGDTDFITMELLKGQTLRELMKARKAGRRPFTPAEVREVGAVIGMALEYAHKYTVHRDVKPENVWVEEDGSYKLMDFGIARLMSNSQLTETTTSMGTAYYMAPEQLHSAKAVDGRADQYALAVMLYELVAGHVPAGRIKPLHQLNGRFPRGASLAIDKALDPQPGERFPGMGAFVKALHARGGLEAGPVAKVAGGVVAAAVLVAGGVAVWPWVSGLLPDREAEQVMRGQAIQAQGIIETLLKRVEGAERDLDSQVRDAKSAVDRYDGMVRMARSEGEKAELNDRLREAQTQLALLTEVRDAAIRCVHQSDALAKVRGQQAVGAAALRDGEVRQAANDLGAAQGALELLLQQPVAIRDSIGARSAYEEARESIDKLGKQEDKNVVPYMDAVTLTITETEQAVAECRYQDAVRLYERATSETGQATNRLIDDLVAAYKAFISRALADKRTTEAGMAVERAKTLEKMKQVTP